MADLGVSGTSRVFAAMPVTSRTGPHRPRTYSLHRGRKML